MSIPVKSLDAASTAGPGAVHDLETTQAQHSVTAAISDFSSPGNWTIYLQVSLDGVSWFSITSQTLNENVQIHLTAAFPARYVRASLAVDEGTVSISADAWVGSA